jgi:hypothetical protein
MTESNNDYDTCEVCGNRLYGEGESCTGCGWPAVPENGRGLDAVPEPCAPWCDRVLSRAETVGFGPVVDRLRKLDTQPQRRLNDAGYQHRRIGVSVKNLRSWKRKRKHVEDTDLYDYLVADAVTCTLAFYQARHGYALSEREAFCEAAIEGDLGLGPEENMAKTYRWFNERDLPTAEELAAERGLDVVSPEPRASLTFSPEPADADEGEESPTKEPETARADSRATTSDADLGAFATDGGESTGEDVAGGGEDNASGPDSTAGGQAQLGEW